MLDKDKTEIIGFLDSVGNQNIYGQIYQNLLLRENIIPIFETIKNQTTGLCIVIYYNRDRAYITDLGDSISISDEFVERNWNKFKNVKLIYIELFILKMKRDIFFKLADLGLRDKTFYRFNLPSDFFLKNYFFLHKMIKIFLIRC